MPPAGAPEGGNILSGLPKWAYYVGGAGIVGVAYIFYRNRKQAQAAQQAGSGSTTYSAGAQAGAYGSPLPGSGVLQPILLQQPISVDLSGVKGSGGGKPPPPPPPPKPVPTTKAIRVVDTAPTNWAALAAQPADVQQYLRALAAQTAKTGGWTTVPMSSPVPAGATLTASGPGYVTYTPGGQSGSVTAPIPNPAASSGATFYA